MRKAKNAKRAVALLGTIYSRQQADNPTLQPAASGGVSFRGALFLYSTSPKWQRLNAVASLFEYEVDPDDSFKGVLTEWK